MPRFHNGTLRGVLEAQNTTSRKSKYGKEKTSRRLALDR